MDDCIRGKAYVLADDIDTDQIIPAEYLSYNPAAPEERKYFGRYACHGVPAGQRGLPDGNIPLVPENQWKSPYTILIAGRNFGCGSSREHAPLALAEAGIRAVVAQFYARIFFRNSVNGGYLVPCQSTDRLVEQIATGDECEIDLANNRLTHLPSGKTYCLQPLGDVRPIIEAGGIFAYARQTGMLKDNPVNP